jgi:hypothetical protein
VGKRLRSAHGRTTLNLERNTEDREEEEVGEEEVEVILPLILPTI